MKNNHLKNNKELTAITETLLIIVIITQSNLLYLNLSL